VRSTQVRYLVREGLFGLRRRRLSGTVAVFIMASSLLMLAIFSLVTINLDRILQTVRGDIDMVVYLDDDIHEEDRGRLAKDLRGMSGVRDVRYVDRESALRRFRVELADDAELLDALESNPLPASFELSLDAAVQDSERLAALSTSLRQYPGVVEVVAQIEWVRRLDRFTRIFMLVTAVIGIIVLVSATFVISHTVRLTVEERADQVEIMRLVGATVAFIRTPFLIGGAVQGAAAGSVAMVVLAAAAHVVRQQIDGLYFFAPAQLAGFVLLSTMLGAVGSLFALRRHLRL
jgi:cell division transport system permease protein